MKCGYVITMIIVQQITRFPILFSRSLLSAFYPLALPQSAQHFHTTAFYHHPLKPTHRIAHHLLVTSAERQATQRVGRIGPSYFS